MKIARLGLLLLLGLAAGRGALAAPTMQVWVDSGEHYVNHFPAGTSSIVLDLVLTVDSDGEDLSGIEFDFAGVPSWAAYHFRTSYPVPGTTNSGSTENGEYRLSFEVCVPACERIEVLRQTYVFTTAYLGFQDLVLTVSGSGAPGNNPMLENCDGLMVEAPMGGAGGGYTCASVVWVPAGATVLFPQEMACPLGFSDSYIDQAPYADCVLPVPVAGISAGRLKSIYGGHGAPK